jgi:phage baseplate assembly protein gpV
MSDEQVNQLSAYLDGELSSEDRAAVEDALAESAFLRAMLGDLMKVRDWMRDHPGRRPQSDVWPDILAAIGVPDAEEDVAPPRTLPRRVATRWSSLPPFGSPIFPPAVRKLSIAALVAIAMFGMGRQMILEQRAKQFEESARLRDLEMLQVVSEAGWSYSAQSLRGRIGRRFAIRCPRLGRAAAVWGTGTYTDDSSVCTAAVHAGLITFADGGVVTVEVRPGSEAYAGSERHGVETRGFGSWSGSFVFVTDGMHLEEIPALISWRESAGELRGQDGTELALNCAAGGEASAVWGTGIYTDDSSICTAAVHAGLVTFENGGLVTIEILPGQTQYRATERNGVETRGFGSWGGSFAFVEGGERLEIANEPALIRWSADAADFRAMEGFRVTVRCPAGGEPSAIWGTDVYTDDSSVCNAAVHSGLITFEDGGTVTFDVLPGLSSYLGTAQHGIESLDYGQWRGSFSFVK